MAMTCTMIATSIWRVRESGVASEIAAHPRSTSIAVVRVARKMAPIAPTTGKNSPT